MIYPSWLEVDAILDEYYAPTPPTYTPPAEAALSQAVWVCVCMCVWIVQEAVNCTFQEEKSCETRNGKNDVFGCLAQSH